MFTSVTWLLLDLRTFSLISTEDEDQVYPAVSPEPLYPESLSSYNNTIQIIYLLQGHGYIEHVIMV